jgi:hypothetical protein
MFKIHKNRIARSTKYNRNSILFNIYFPQTSYFEMPTNKGNIVSINEFNNRLIIRHTQTTFLTIPNQRIQTSAGEATIGNNDLFDIEPEELVSTDNGFAGSSSKFNSIKTEFGITIIDSFNGKIFLFSSQLEEISRIGNRFLFERNFRILNKYKRFIYTDIDYVNWEDDKVAFMIPSTQNIYSFNESDKVFSVEQGGFVEIVEIQKYNQFILLCTNIQQVVEEYILQIIITDNNAIYETDDIVSQASTGATGIVLYLSDSAVYVKKTSTGINNFQSGGSALLNDTDTTSANITSIAVTTLVNTGNENDTITVYKEIDDPSYNDIIVGYDSLNQRLLFTKNEELGFSQVNYRGFEQDDMVFNNNDIIINNNYQRYEVDQLNNYVVPVHKKTYSFSLTEKIWISEHSYVPKFYLNKTNELLYYDTLLRRTNNRLVQGGQFIIDIVFNRENLANKVLLELIWKTIKQQFSGAILTTTFDDIKFDNSTQSSNTIALVPLTTLDTANANTRLINGTWHYNTIRDSSDLMMIDSYVVIRFRISGENLLSLYGYDVKYNVLNQ